MLNFFLTSFMININDIRIAKFLFTCFFVFNFFEKDNTSFFYFHKLVLSIIKTFEKKIRNCNPSEFGPKKIIPVDKFDGKDLANIIEYTLYGNKDFIFDLENAKARRKAILQKTFSEEKSLKKLPFNYSQEIKSVECDFNYLYVLKNVVILFLLVLLQNNIQKEVIKY